MVATSERRLGSEIIFLLPIIVVVGVLGRLAGTSVVYTIILTIIFTINIIVRFLLVNEKYDWIFFVLGIIAGGGNDLASQVNGIYRYTSLTLLPFLQGLMPVWMIVFWGQVFLLFRKVFHVAWFKGKGFAKDGRFFRGWLSTRLLADIIVLVVLRIIIYRTFMDPLIPAAIYGGIIVARLLLFRPRKNELLIMAILPYAFMFEGLMVTFGLYVYYNPVFMGLPAWLLLWWAFLVPLLLKQVFDMIEYVIAKKAAEATVA
ncbi:MAG TPA: hypothetical protein VKM55_08575 [Candidatus Lokiarchaeia archaeon]|nr:hypothetical protein [Candidatus Lokiarchaeia archaeon]